MQIGKAAEHGSAAFLYFAAFLFQTNRKKAARGQFRRCAERSAGASVFF